MASFASMYSSKREVSFTVLVIVSMIIAIFLSACSGRDNSESVDPDSAEVYISYENDTKFMQAYSQISVLMLMVHEYYATHGDYPESMRDLSASNLQLGRWNSYVDTVSFDQDGVIMVELSERKFGRNHYLKLIPDNQSLTQTWECLTNVELSRQNNVCAYIR